MVNSTAYYALSGSALSLQFTNCDAGFGGVTPLHLAVMNGHLNIVGLLITRGANIKVKF